MSKKRLTTSKILTYMFSIFFMICVFLVLFIRVKFNIDTFGVLGYVISIQIMIVASYFGKSSMENYQKIKSNIDNVVSNLSNNPIPQNNQPQQ